MKELVSVEFTVKLKQKGQILPNNFNYCAFIYKKGRIANFLS